MLCLKDDRKGQFRPEVHSHRNKNTMGGTAGQANHTFLAGSGPAFHVHLADDLCRLLYDSDRYSSYIGRQLVMYLF